MSFAVAKPTFGIPNAYIRLLSLHVLDFSIASAIFLNDLKPKPSMLEISLPCSHRWYIDAKSVIRPSSTSFSSVLPLIPSMFIASRLTKCLSSLFPFAGQSSFSHQRVNTPLPGSSCTHVGSPQAGHVSGISHVSLHVTFSLICGIIMFAL